jgi:glycosyltransferase involved in cell wall biosynthesis
MPTTLICTSAPIGLGNMGISLASNVDSIDQIVLIDYPEYTPETCLSFPKSKVRLRSGLQNLNMVRVFLENEISDSKRKFLFLETSWGLSALLPKERTYIFPMWEQPSAMLESKFCSNIISTTNHGHRLLSSLNIFSRKVDFPVNISQKFQPVDRVQNILHNAGSFGGNFRKGTPEAIEIFQNSELHSSGVNLIISALRPPDDELLRLVEKAPQGIEFRVGVKETWAELYENIDLLLYPSRLEGHALPVLEAHSFGIPALCTNVSPINEYESDADYLLPIIERTGNSVKVNVTASVDVLQKVCSESQIQKSLMLRKSVEHNYSWLVMKEVYESLFS